MKYIMWSVIIFAALFVAVPGGIVLWMGLRSVWNGLASSHWPTASGVVVQAGMKEDQAKDARSENTYNFYSMNLKFCYPVNGRDYTTETVQFGRALGSGDISNEAVLFFRYPEGSKVKVFYHPHDPALATVKTGVHTDAALYLAVGAILILFGAFCVLGYLWSERDLPLTPYVVSFLWVFFILSGAAILPPGLRNLWYAHASQGWPTTKGVVVFAEEDATEQLHERMGRVTTHGAPLVVQYEVNGIRYFSNVRHFGQFVGSDQNWAETILQQYPSGKDVPVSYCPADPDLAALEPGINNESYYLPGAGLIFLLFGMTGMLWTILR